jgi:hypothetical protein
VIQLVDQAIEQFLRRAVPLPESSIDVSFQAPDKTWGAAINRPTVNVFLYDVKRNPRYGQAGVTERANGDGRIERRATSPVVDLRYFLTAWASEGRDEHQLLGEVLRAVVANTAIPVEDVPEPLASAGSITLTLSTFDDAKPGNFWSAIEGKMKPGLELALTLPVDAFAWEAAGPPTEGISLDLSPKPKQPAPDPAMAKPPMRRTRQNGQLVMEGRPDPVTDAGGE